MTTTYPLPTQAHRWIATTTDTFGRTLVETDLYGANRKYTYEGNSHLPATEIDANGILWAYTYDSLGNTLTVTKDGVQVPMEARHASARLSAHPAILAKGASLRHWKYMVPYGLFLLAIGLDIASTYVLMKHFGGIETDPAANWAFHKIGTKAMFIPIVLGTVGGFGLIKYAQIRRARWLEVLVILMFCGAAFAHGYAGVNNIIGAMHSSQPNSVVITYLPPASGSPLTAAPAQ